MENTIRPPSPSSTIRSSSFLRLWTGSTASGLATWALPFVLGLAVLDALLSPVDLGIALAARTVGFLLAVPVSGVLADREGRRKMVFFASVTAAIGIPVIIAGLLQGGGSSLMLITCGALIAGVGQGACRPAYQALVPMVVSGAELQPANAAMSISVRVTNLVGPAAATGLALIAGVPVALGTILVLWIVSATLPPWPGENPSRASKPDRLTLATFFADLGAGVGEARRHPWFLGGLCALTAVIATGYSVTGVLVPVISRDVYGGAILLAGSAMGYTLGALLGALVIARWRPVNQGWWALGGLALYCLVPFALLIPAPLAIPVIAFVIAGFGIELFNVPWFTATQREVAPDKLARVSSLDFLLSYGLAPLGLAVIAPLAQQLGTTPVLVITGFVCLLAPAIAACIPSARAFKAESQMFMRSERSRS